VKELEKVMRDQSEQGVKQLKALVEKILSEEAKQSSQWVGVHTSFSARNSARSTKKIVLA